MAVADASSAVASPQYRDVLGHPRPLWMLFITEFWERFCFYGMRWMLALYIVTEFFGGDAQGQASANQTYGAFLGLIFAVAILGGYVADRILGYQRSVLLGAVFIASGLFVLLVPDQTAFMMGLSTIIVGNGLFKPNIATMIGSLYAPGDTRRDRGFTIFYMGVNVGAFVAPLITGYVVAKFGYLDLATPTERAHGLRVGFAVSGFGMVLGALWFFIGRRGLGAVGRPPPGMEGLGRLIAVAVAGFVLVPVIYFLLHHNPWLTLLLGTLFVLCFVSLVATGIKDGPVQRDRIYAMLLLFLANVLFFMFYEQAGASLNFLAEHLVDRRMFGSWTFPTGWFQSVSPLAVITLAPPIAAAWGWLARREMEPSIPRKFGIALVANGLAFFVLAYALGHWVNEEGMVPFWTLAACYVLKTIGELHLVPVGLSMVTQLAPARMVGVTMGAWFLSISIGNSLAGWFAARMSAAGGKSGLTIASAHDGFTLSFWLLLVAGAVVLLAAPRISKLMHGVR
jgi:proton-dependent oligopeptide transporter, POT family